MRPARNISDNRIDPPCDVAAFHEEMRIEELAADIEHDLRTAGRWYSFATPERHKWTPADAVDEIFGMDQDAQDLFNASVAAMWGVPKGADHGQAKLNAAEAIARLMDDAIVKLAKQLAKNEFAAEKASRDEH